MSMMWIVAAVAAVIGIAVYMVIKARKDDQQNTPGTQDESR